jgi:hypothetical protein
LARIALVADMDWPPHAVTLRVLDPDGREVHSAIKRIWFSNAKAK